MEYIRLGKSDLEVSRICMGCMGFGDANRDQRDLTRVRSIFAFV